MTAVSINRAESARHAERREKKMAACQHSRQGFGPDERSCQKHHTRENIATQASTSHHTVCALEEHFTFRMFNLNIAK